MRRITQIVTAEHSLLCNESYLELLKHEMSQSDYIICVNSHTELATDRVYRYYESSKISIEEYGEAKSIIIKVHNACLKKGNLYE